jgi:hypothetical protein
MNCKKKSKFVCVSPISSKAKNRFSNIMDNLHSCAVEQEKIIDGIDCFFLVSLNKKYCFWVPKKGNDHWKIEK